MVDGGRDAIVTAVEVRPTCEGDGQAVRAGLAKHVMAVKRRPRQLVGDRGYGGETAFKDCLAMGVEPVLNVRSLSNRFGFSRDRFTYIPERDVFICPEGKELLHFSDNFRGRQAIYRPLPGSCRDCPLKPECAPGRFDRRVIRRWDADIWEAVIDTVNSRRGRKLLRRRQIVSERIFADAKSKHGLERAQFRGRGKVQIQALLTAAALNLKKLVNRTPAAQSGAAAMAIWRLVGDLALVFRRLLGHAAFRSGESRAEITGPRPSSVCLAAARPI